MTTAYTTLAYTSNIRNTKFHELEIFFSLLFSLNEYNWKKYHNMKNFLCSNLTFLIWIEYNELSFV